MLDLDPHTRLSLVEVLSHPLFARSSTEEVKVRSFIKGEVIKVTLASEPPMAIKVSWLKTIFDTFKSLQRSSDVGDLFRAFDLFIEPFDNYLQ